MDGRYNRICLSQWKKINIKKDVLGHDFIELSLKKHKTNIEVKVKNESNRTSTLKKRKCVNS